MHASDRDKKKEWKLQQRQHAQAAFPISSALLESLFEAVDACVEESGYKIDVFQLAVQMVGPYGRI